MGTARATVDGAEGQAVDPAAEGGEVAAEAALEVEVQDDEDSTILYDSKIG